MYNKNGRISFYTHEEQKAIIAWFKRKIGLRAWKKKLRWDGTGGNGRELVRVRNGMPWNWEGGGIVYVQFTKIETQKHQ